MQTQIQKVAQTHVQKVAEPTTSIVLTTKEKDMGCARSLTARASRKMTTEMPVKSMAAANGLVTASREMTTEMSVKSTAAANGLVTARQIRPAV